MKTPYWFLRKSVVAFLLWPFSWGYFLGSRVVFNFRKFGQIKSRRKIVCVGNILAGGVGKTPIVRQIAKFLDAPVVMRGYKKTENTNGIGDEALMLANDGLLVHTGDRKSNVILLNKQSKDNSPVVMDDGLQNPKIKKDVSIVVFDENIGVGNGFLLPAGPLRERLKTVQNADAIIIIKSNNKNAKKLELPDNVPVFYAENKTVSPYSQKQKLVAFAGIGYPKKFFDSLNNVVYKKAFSDHYQYKDEDILHLIKVADKKGAKPVTTEKDWVRLNPEFQKDIKFAKLETNIDKEFFVWLKDKLNDNIKK
ncbi:MAG: tetraacyldisaccharide 4'-kinase [Alphaproteobacteria bacterium]